MHEPHLPTLPHAPHVPEPHVRGKGLIIGGVIALGILFATGDVYAAGQSINPAASTTDAVVNHDCGSKNSTCSTEFAVTRGVARDAVSLIPPGAVAILVWDVMAPRGEFRYDEEVVNRAKENGNNPFCATCHGVGGALDPNNKWNQQQQQKKFDSLRLLDQNSEADDQAIRAWIEAQPAPK